MWIILGSSTISTETLVYRHIFYQHTSHILDFEKNVPSLTLLLKLGASTSIIRYYLRSHRKSTGKEIPEQAF